MSILDENSGASTNTGLSVTGEMKRNWISTSKWAMFFAIVGFVYIAFALLTMGSTAAIMQTMAMLMRDNPFVDAFMAFIPYMMFITIIMLAVMFFIHFFHLRFSTKIKHAINFSDQQAFTSAWLNLRNHFRLFGIVICVLLAFYVIMLIIGISMGASAASQMNYPE